MQRRVELVADRRLLDVSFEGYKLDGSEPPLVHEALPRPPARPQDTSISHYSLLHARLRALHNGLIPDRTGSSVCYVDEDCSVWLAHPDPLTLSCVFRVPPGYSGPGEHPPTLVLFSPDRALLSNGCGKLLLLNTGNRDVDVAHWMIETDLSPLDENLPFSVLDARYDDDKNVHAILYRIEQDDKHCISILEWIKLSLVDEKWQSEVFRKLKCPGVVHYCSFEPSCGALYIAADHMVDFIRDTNGVKDEEAKNGKQENVYCWLQNADEVTLIVQLSPDLSSFAPTIDANKSFINLSCNGIELMKGQMFGEIEDGLTTWNIDNSGKLSILFMKREQGRIWSNFLKDGDPRGEQVMDPAFVAEVHERLAHLCSETEVSGPTDAPLFNSQQLEECDFDNEEESCLVRLDAASLEVSHRIFLSAHPVILSVQLSSTEATALGLRYDADACIWQPYTAVDQGWSVKHEGTLPAFGYVQSSKQQKKYTACSPNLEYSIVCEGTRHAFIYRRAMQSSQLRQRTPTGDTRNVKIGRQQLLTFERDQEILGLHASNQHLYILTMNNLLCYEMC